MVAPLYLRKPERIIAVEIVDLLPRDVSFACPYNGGSYSRAVFSLSVLEYCWSNTWSGVSEIETIGRRPFFFFFAFSGGGSDLKDEQNCQIEIGIGKLSWNQHNSQPTIVFSWIIFKAFHV
uniref:Uncharacterized protein n=1 Tax=Nelumbo nucifera TaxID=4432 RepID=A0A822ZLX9_NELNU|nr:TPA_asm: hypothetical protein HUJ06_002715 [Nelumbo nucifera]